MVTRTTDKPLQVAAADGLDRLPVPVLKGVGPRVAGRLQRLGIRTVQDVLFHLPLRYEDRTRVVPMGALRAGDQISVSTQSGGVSVWLLDPSRGTSRRLTGDEEAEYWHVWTPDGESIVFGLSSVDWDANRRRSDLWVVGVDGSGLRRLTTSPAGEFTRFGTVRSPKVASSVSTAMRNGDEAVSEPLCTMLPAGSILTWLP